MPQSSKSDDGCVPCSEAKTLAKICTDIGWIKETMKKNQEDKIPERVTALETHKTIATRIAMAALPTLLGTAVVAGWAWLKHLTIGE